MMANRSKQEIQRMIEASRKFQVSKQNREELQWTIAEMKEIVQRERTIRQQAQLAAEQALAAAKEAQKVILQLEQELDSKDQQLEQERAARQAELAVQKAANAAKTADDQLKCSPLKAEKGESAKTMPKCEADESETEDAMCSPSHSVTTTVEDKSSPVKRPRECIETPTASKKPRGPNKNRVKTSPSEASKPKMSLEEARKAAQEEIEKRVEERAKQLLSKK
ncbi:hypothetical protein PR003_g21122 [Phytophthora rubi]|uniref:Uncharacterized protein n=2 Tax=Phytophthora rubi TaxID=129364 RepID=A0A6A3JLG6_9STRA|nr:hypothetical protein PR002_g20518 [Phytophthora rubi]KAE9306940.1 hypothetical protein PR003_g21122 [Phytophthora rubi]